MIEIRNCFQGKTFTFCQVIDRETGKTGEGISRRSRLDKFSPDIGMQIAEGRAREALERKLKNKTIYSQFMG